MDKSDLSIDARSVESNVVDIAVDYRVGGCVSHDDRFKCNGGSSIDNHSDLDTRHHRLTEDFHLIRYFYERCITEFGSVSDRLCYSHYRVCSSERSRSLMIKLPFLFRKSHPHGTEWPNDRELIR